MGDIEFECEHCNADLVVELEGRGHQIQCPACGTRTRIPGPQRVNLDQGQPTQNRESRNIEYDIGLTLRSRTSMLAYVAFGLVVIGSWFTFGLAIIPGLICGHMALAECNKDENVQGKPFAVASLAIGYLILGVAMLLMLLMCAGIAMQ